MRIFPHIALALRQLERQYAVAHWNLPIPFCKTPTFKDLLFKTYFLFAFVNLLYKNHRMIKTHFHAVINTVVLVSYMSVTLYAQWFIYTRSISNMKCFTCHCYGSFLFQSFHCIGILRGRIKALKCG